MLLLAYCNLGT